MYIVSLDFHFIYYICFMKPIRIYLIFLLIIFLSSASKAIEPLETLFVKYDIEKDDQVRCNIALNIVSALPKDALELRLNYAKKALQNAKICGHETEMWESLHSLSIAYQNIDSLTLSFKTCQDALALCDVSKNNKQQFKTYSQMGNLLMDFNNYSLAGEYFLKALTLVEIADYKTEYTLIYGRLGNLYFALNDFDKAQEHFFKSLDFALKHNENDSVQLANLYNSIAGVYKINGNLIKAKEYIQKAVAYYELMGYKSDQAGCLLNLGIIEKYLLNKEQCFLNFHKAKDIAAEVEEFDLLGLVYYNFSFTFQGYFQYDSCFYYANKSNALIEKYNLFELKGMLAVVYHNYYEHYNNVDSTYKYLQSYYSIKDSLSKAKHHEKISKLERSYLFNKKQFEYDKLKQKSKYTFLFMFSIAILLLVIITLLYSNFRIKQKRNGQKQLQLETDIESRNKALTSEVMQSIQQKLILSKHTQQLLDTSDIQSNPEVKKSIVKLLKLIDDSLDSKMWEEFDLRFKEVHTAFYDNLYNDYPDLSSNEIRLCAFLRLKMNSKEISRITSQSLTAIEKARIRLRKKLNISGTEINLTSFLNKY